MRSSLRLAIAGLIAGAALACQTVVVAEIPAPSQPCPTREDEGRLADLLPNPKDDPDLALEVDGLGRRFVAAGVYCRMAARRLN